MSASTNFRIIFTKKNLKNIYFRYIRYNCAIGIDRINRKTFEENLSENINIIYRKVRNGTYQISKYKEKLISKGRNKYPRVISIPTIRDKIVLKALYELIKTVFPDHSPFLHKIINELVKYYKSGCYESYLRLDIKEFYPSIRHDILNNIITKHIKKKEVLNLILKSISQITVVKSSNKDKTHNKIGIPQGLSISNILANLYLNSLDNKHYSSKNYIYFRYVDDILILCNSKDLGTIKKEIFNDCNKLGLEVHNEKDEPSKMKYGEIKNGFEYLGYKFAYSNVTVRQKSIDKLRESLIKQFTYYKYSKKKNINLLSWAINLRITGCIFNDTKYGWLFYFSQIDDLKLMYSLDHFVEKQSKRYGLNPSAIKFKKFYISYNKIKYKIKKTHYIPNFDKKTINEKKQILKDIFSIETKSMRDNDIIYEFNRRIYRSVKDLEKDLARPY